MGPTLPNRLFDLAGTSGNWTSDSTPPASNLTFPTILGQLSGAGIPWNYDYSGTEANLTPLLIPAIANSACAVERIQQTSTLASQLSAATPPAVIMIDPSHDALYAEHPPQNVSLGAQWTLSVLQTIFASPVGSSSAVLLWWDEAGGFWDPVDPPTEGPLGDGFRIPFLVISPWTRAGEIDHQTLDPASVLSFIDSNWGLPALNGRVGSAPGLAGFFNFSLPPRPYEGPAGSVSLATDAGTPVRGPAARPALAGVANLPAPFVPPAARTMWETAQSICGPRRVAASWPESGSRNITPSRCSSSPRARSSPSR